MKLQSYSKNEIRSEIARIKYLMVLLEFNQSKLSKILNVPQSTISLVMTNTYSMSEKVYTTRKRLLRFLETEFAKLV